MTGHAVNSLAHTYPSPNRYSWHVRLVAVVGLPSNTPPPAPPSCSECASSTQPAGGGQPTQSASRMWRSSDGKTRIDTPTTSVISDPASQHSIVLDHVKKEATVIPMSSPEAAASAPSAAPGATAAPTAPPVQVEPLGKSMIEGHEVEGTRYTLPASPPPTKPAMPGMKVPGMPGTPQPPKSPGPPGAPAALKLPPKPSVTEIWTSVKLKTPVLTKTTTAVGEQTTYCKPTETAEHPPSVFQIPPGYKIKPNP